MCCWWLRLSSPTRCTAGRRWLRPRGRSADCRPPTWIPEDDLIKVCGRRGTARYRRFNSAKQLAIVGARTGSPQAVSATTRHSMAASEAGHNTLCGSGISLQSQALNQQPPELPVRCQHRPRRQQYCAFSCRLARITGCSLVLLLKCAHSPAQQRPSPAGVDVAESRGLLPRGAESARFRAPAQGW